MGCKRRHTEQVRQLADTGSRGASVTLTPKPVASCVHSRSTAVRRGRLWERLKTQTRWSSRHTYVHGEDHDWNTRITYRSRSATDFDPTKPTCFGSGRSPGMIEKNRPNRSSGLGWSSSTTASVPPTYVHRYYARRRAGRIISSTCCHWLPR
jgi:hypothetical protein